MNITTDTFIIFGTCILVLIGFSLIFFVAYYQRKQFLNEIKIREERKQFDLELQRKLLKNSIEIQESERRKLAKDLHDEVGTILSTLKMANNQLLKNPESIEATLKIALNNKELIEESISLVRNISRDLVPQTLENFGFINAVEEFFHKLEKHTGIRFSLKHDNINENFRFKPNVELSLFRIIQELANNAIKHSKTSQVDLFILLENRQLYLYFSDEGIGFDFNSNLLKKNGGLGLRNIESRLSLINGEFAISSEKDKGTKYEIWINKITEK